MTVKGRKRISLPGSGGIDESSVAAKGPFVIYTTDQKRHLVPLSCLSNNIFVELLQLSEEEFVLSSHGPIVLPCDSALFRYIVFIVQQALDRQHEKTLLSSIPRSHKTHNSLVCG
ncbi:hypothetical protein V6N13_115616 [Hibiscus sabdariffa]|uniref:Uncharacterized protein n=1 Tax=Hibiscus sabdariffa TaxID=183260 RepID=A0ABR2CUU0_9ROSI